MVQTRSGRLFNASNSSNMTTNVFNPFNPYYNNILLCATDGTPNKTANVLIQDAKRGLGEDKSWDGDKKTVHNFLDYLDEQSKNYDW